MMPDMQIGRTRGQLLDRIAELEAQNEALMRHNSRESDYSKELEAKLDRMREVLKYIATPETIRDLLGDKE